MFCMECNEVVKKKNIIQNLFGDFQCKKCESLISLKGMPVLRKQKRQVLEDFSFNEIPILHKGDIIRIAKVEGQYADFIANRNIVAGCTYDDRVSMGSDAGVDENGDSKHDKIKDVVAAGGSVTALQKTWIRKNTIIII